MLQLDWGGPRPCGRSEPGSSSAAIPVEAWLKLRVAMLWWILCARCLLAGEIGNAESIDPYRPWKFRTRNPDVLVEVAWEERGGDWARVVRTEPLVEDVDLLAAVEERYPHPRVRVSTRAFAAKRARYALGVHPGFACADAVYGQFWQRDSLSYAVLDVLALGAAAGVRLGNLLVNFGAGDGIRTTFVFCFCLFFYFLSFSTVFSSNNSLKCPLTSFSLNVLSGNANNLIIDESSGEIDLKIEA